MQAAAGGERAHHLVLGQVERVGRLVQEYAPALADHGTRADPVHEARNVVRADLDALRATRGAGREDEVLRLVARHPARAIGDDERAARCGDGRARIEHV